MRVVPALCLLLAGCATGYHSTSLTGGFSDMRLDAQTFQVSFRGNGYTHRERVQQYAFYRCAELALQSGFDFFVILDSSGSSSQSYYTTPGTHSSTTTATASGYGNTAYGTAHTYGTYSPGVTIPITKHGAVVTFKAYQGQKPTWVQGAFDAREVVTYMGPYVDPQGSVALLQWANRASQPQPQAITLPKAAPASIEQPPGSSTEK